MIPLPPLAPDDFAGFFKECWGHKPFPWQIDFAHRVSAGRWPRYVCAPTGSGKTGCLDAAVFALALQAGEPLENRTAGRRIFFIVNRRVIVDEAYLRARQLADALAGAAPDSVTQRVAARLRSLTGEDNAPPLACTQLRGGVYRDRSWARSLLQPMIVCSTVDQAGSRLLFRGYGVTPGARPIHAALVAHDSLFLLDEAHISRPFVDTLEWFRRFRLHKQTADADTIALPFEFIQMTGTPPEDTPADARVMLSDDDRQHPVLRPRLQTPKPAALKVSSKAKGKARDRELAASLVAEAEAILKESRPRSIAIMVNRVAVARAVHQALANRNATLLIGRMRPIDRDGVTQSLVSKLKTRPAGTEPTESQTDSPTIVVSTQCLEVGADFDFDALVTEAASLDALRQRFGRLNRGGRAITPRAAIVLPGEQEIDLTRLSEDTPADPIYGNAIPRTWHFLQTISQDGIVDFGLDAIAGKVDALSADARSLLVTPSFCAPVLLPAYLDCWVQTNPAPAAAPDIAIFLHGPRRDMAEVMVCWRADLPVATPEQDGRTDQWAEVLSFCPPTVVECLPVPLHVMRQWLAEPRQKFSDQSGDAGDAPPVDPPRTVDPGRPPVLIWRGDDSMFAGSPTAIRPGDTLVMRAQDGGWNALGHIPNAPPDPAEANRDLTLSRDDLQRIDLGLEGRAMVHRQAVLRIHPALVAAPAPDTPEAELWRLAIDPDEPWTRTSLKEMLLAISGHGGRNWLEPAVSAGIVAHLAGVKASALQVHRYPDAAAGIAIVSRVRMPSAIPAESLDDDPGDDSLSKRDDPQELEAHTLDVTRFLDIQLRHLPVTAFADALRAAAEMHDWGKADPRFQAMLRMASAFAPGSSALLAKSGVMPESREESRAARLKTGLPDGFRHEMLSMQLAALSPSLMSDDHRRALVLHLIATHHGFGRPFAPLVIDDKPPSVGISGVSLSSDDRTANPVHALDSGATDRFWLLVRRHGWWGLAFLEAMLRLADQQASAQPGPTT